MLLSVKFPAVDKIG